MDWRSFFSSSTIETVMIIFAQTSLVKEFNGMTKRIFVPCPVADPTQHCPPMSARRLDILLRPSPVVGGDSGFEAVAEELNPLPLSEIWISNAALAEIIEIPARVAPECLRMLVSASWVARKRWWRICEESGCGGN